jgi:hypothetical protein
MIDFGIYLSIAIFLVCIWMMICNHRAYVLRGQIIHGWDPGSSDFWLAHNDFQRVSYHQHVYYLATFRDPRQLYSGITWQKMGWYK